MYELDFRKFCLYFWGEIVSGVYKENILVEYKSMRSPVSFEIIEKMQKAYDKIKLKQKDKIRVIQYLSYDEYLEIT